MLYHIFAGREHTISAFATSVDRHDVMSTLERIREDDVLDSKKYLISFGQPAAPPARSRRYSRTDAIGGNNILITWQRQNTASVKKEGPVAPFSE